MRRPFPSLAILLGFVLSAGSARADRVVLASGEVIEGKVTRRDGRVVIEVGSGTVALPADLVARVEEGDSAVTRFETRYAALRSGDVKGRLALADFCLDHDMRARERQLLHEVLAIDPDNAPARERLGYVRTESGWTTREDAMREQGLVLREGEWMTPMARATLERERSDALAEAARRRELEELETTRRELARQQAELEVERLRAEMARASAFTSDYFVYPGYAAPVCGAWPHALDCDIGHPRMRRPAPPRGLVPIDPTSMSVVKVPYRKAR